MSNAPRAYIHKKTNGPCKDCPDRYVGCHSKCSKYIEWKAQEQQRKVATYEMYRTFRVVEDYEIKEKQKNIKRKRRS
jgi:hypothetical protein